MRSSTWYGFTDFRSEMNRLQHEMNRLFGRGLHADNSAYPGVNVWTDADHVYVEAELPGVEQGDLEIFVDAGNQVSIKGERKQVEVEQSAWHRRERSTGAFHRVVELPVEVNPDAVTAELKHGVLLLKLGKREEVKPRRVSVKAD